MSRPVTAAITAILVLVVSGCTGLVASPTDPPVQPPTDVANVPSQGEARQAIVIAPEPVVEPETVAEADPDPAADPEPEAEADPEPVADTTSDVPLELEDLLGKDGRLSVLLLGTDKREGIVGERTDAIIVATISPDTGKVAMISMPRDTVNVPIGPDEVFRDRINTLYWSHTRKARKQKVALRRTLKDFEYAFDTEIDYYALVDFRGLVRLVNSIGGIDVTLKEKLHDPTIHLKPNGLKLKAGERHLDGLKALAFTRTRHTDSDYERSRRQQQAVTAVAGQVRDRGLAALPKLIELASKKVVTDFPMAAAPLLLELAQTAVLDKPRSIVLEPGRFAKPGPEVYTIAPKVARVREVFAKAMKPLN